MKKTIAAGLILAAVIAVGLTVRLPFFTVRTGDEVVYFSPLIGRKQVVYHYIHSVEKGPVREYFQAFREGFLLHKTSFTSQGAGLPLDRGEFEMKDGLFIRKDLNDRYERLQFRLSGQFEEQLIEISGQEMKMAEWGDPGEPIIMEVKSAAELIKFFAGK